LRKQSITSASAVVINVHTKVPYLYPIVPKTGTSQQIFSNKSTLPFSTQIRPTEVELFRANRQKSRS